MTRFARLLWIVPALALGALALTVGCPNPTPTPTDDTQALSNTERTGADEAVDAAGAVVLAAGAVQGIAQGTVPPSTGQTNNGLQFGECPVNTLTLGGNGQVSFSMTSDFGSTGCDPQGDGSFTCAGVISGTYAPSTDSKTVTLTFDGLTCANRSVTGTAQLVFAISGNTISADGDLDVTATRDGDKADVNGEVMTTYDLSTGDTTIDSFIGTVGEGGETRDCTMTDCLINFRTNGNFIPESGTMIVTGDSGRQITIVFDADSPATGNVTVSIDGGPSFVVNVNEL